MHLNRHRKSQIGFTLIELMIVMAIIGILALIIVPQYQSYTLRAKLTEVMVIAAKDKVAIAEYFLTHNTMPTNSQSAGLNTNADQSKYITSISYAVAADTADQATLSYQLNNNTLGNQLNAGDSLDFTATGNSSGIHWSCSTNNTQGTQNDFNYAPSSCR